MSKWFIFLGFLVMAGCQVTDTIKIDGKVSDEEAAIYQEIINNQDK